MDTNGREPSAIFSAAESVRRRENFSILIRVHSYFYPEQFCFPAQIFPNWESPADGKVGRGLDSSFTS